MRQCDIQTVTQAYRHCRTNSGDEAASILAIAVYRGIYPNTPEDQARQAVQSLIAEPVH
jgi:hypothetical protein